MNKRLIGFTAAMAFASGSAFAAGQEQMPGFSELDQDGNGQLSMQEAEPRDQLVQNWDQYDQNKDGNIDQAEFSAFEEQTGGGGGQQQPSGGGM